MGNHLAKDWVYDDKTKVYVAVDGTADNSAGPVFVGDARHLNSVVTPAGSAGAATNFSYLTTDGSNDAPYIKSTP